MENDTERRRKGCWRIKQSESIVSELTRNSLLCGHRRNAVLPTGMGTGANGFAGPGGAGYQGMYLSSRL